MQNQINFQFPILTIKKVKPLLSKENKVFAYEILVITANGSTLKVYENKGLDLREYIGKEMECLLEITKGEFDYIPEKKNVEGWQNMRFKYQWIKRLHEYFPELVKLRDKVDITDDDEDSSVEELFESTTGEVFKNWGLNGLNMGIYQAKPLLSSSDGFFLINEYEFEEEIEELELGEEVNIKIDELYLRGIRPRASSKDSKQKQILPQAKPKEQPPPPIQKEEAPQKKKGRFDSLLDI